MAKTKKPASARTKAAARTTSRKAGAKTRAPRAKKRAAANEIKLKVSTSRRFESWLAEQNVNLAFTACTTGKLFFLGLNVDGKLSVFNRTLERCRGLAYGMNTLWVSGLYQINKFVDVAAGQTVEGEYDSLFVPQANRITGDLDIHDMAVGRDGRLYFVNTLFSCIATVSESHSFKPVWQPVFIGRLAAEDRCHLNGMAMNNGMPVVATAVAETDVADGWRENRAGGGVVIDIESGKSVLKGLSMPHSPRVYQKRLWLHNSGTGHFGYADLERAKFTPIAFCPGYLRGMDFAGDYAVAGLSKPRDDTALAGLELDQTLKKEKAEARCGIYIIDLKSGEVAHWARFEGIVSELYDVAVLPGRRNTAAIGFQSDEIRRVISIEA